MFAKKHLIVVAVSLVLLATAAAPSAFAATQPGPSYLPPVGGGGTACGVFGTGFNQAPWIDWVDYGQFWFGPAYCQRSSDQVITSLDIGGARYWYKTMGIYSFEGWQGPYVTSGGVGSTYAVVVLRATFNNNATWPWVTHNTRTITMCLGSPTFTASQC